MFEQKALLWEKASSPAGNKAVKCFLCNHYCVIGSGKRGICGVRINEDGTLCTLTANAVAAVNLDPVEKKPLYHFYPGTYTFSIGTEGCNFACDFCQNHSLAHSIKDEIRPAKGQHAAPDSILKAALNAGAGSISYTYSEPTIFFELMLKTAAMACEQNFKNIIVSNGYQSPQCLTALKDFIHAANFDLKAFSDSFYKKLCGAKLAPVLDTLKRAIDFGWWVEVTTLLIPGENDSPEELYELALFIKNELGRHVPWHVSRYRPAYKMTLPPTPIESLTRALNIGKEVGLDYVYIGNITGHGGENTYCPSCQTLLIHRIGYDVEVLTSEGLCPGCKTPLRGVGL